MKTLTSLFAIVMMTFAMQAAEVKVYPLLNTTYLSLAASEVVTNINSIDQVVGLATSAKTNSAGPTFKTVMGDVFGMGTNDVWARYNLLGDVDLAQAPMPVPIYASGNGNGTNTYAAIAVHYISATTNTITLTFATVPTGEWDATEAGDKFTVAIGGTGAVIGKAATKTYNIPDYVLVNKKKLRLQQIISTADVATTPSFIYGVYLVR